MLEGDVLFNQTYASLDSPGSMATRFFEFPYHRIEASCPKMSIMTAHRVDDIVRASLRYASSVKAKDKLYHGTLSKTTRPNCFVSLVDIHSLNSERARTGENVLRGRHKV